jgi:GNAT superfamily N-acetyltransferase
MSKILIRAATIDDASLILEFVKGLAKYEKAEHEVLATEAHIRSSLFESQSTTQAVICEKSGCPIGFAVYFYNYSTWLGKHGLYLEDLYVLPSERGSGAGKSLLKHLAQIAVQQGCGRFEWSVLDWNEPAINFYESFGAKAQEEWIGYRLSGQDLVKFAES